MNQGEGVITRLRAHSQSQNSPFYVPQIKTVVSANNLQEKEMETPTPIPKQNEVELQKQLQEIQISPEDVSLQQWLTMFTSLNTTLLDLKSEITELKGLKGMVETFTAEWKEGVDESRMEINNKLDEQDFRIKLLTNIVIRQDEKIQQLEAKITAAYEREIKPIICVFELKKVTKKIEKSCLRI